MEIRKKRKTNIPSWSVDTDVETSGPEPLEVNAFTEIW